MPRSLNRTEENWNMKFVLEIKKYPCLYDYKLEDYTNRGLVDATWEKVAKTVGETPDSCKKRWKNLRTVFVRKRKTCKFKGKSYYLGAAMQFIVPFIKDRFIDEGPSNVSSPEVSDLSEHTNSEPGDNMDMSDCDIKVGETEIVDQTSDLIMVPSTSKSDGSGTSHIKISPKNRDSNRKRSSNSDETLINSKKSKHNYIDIKGRRTFLLSLLPEIETMSNKQFRQLRRLVLDAVDNILDSSSSDSSPNFIKQEFASSSLPLYLDNQKLNFHSSEDENL
ncbi:hypothetical protein ABEB36_002746 [Hypothenemus hampei]|uniref:MADF domain-containing protein n=1 Tax=Hypothenemus hampei TaxID=57062 RepID=A0ABD1F6V0_HYPHA